MAWNVPDDWGMYYRKCGVCGGRYHLSGSDVCNCPDVPEKFFCEYCGEEMEEEGVYCTVCKEERDTEEAEKIAT